MAETDRASARRRYTARLKVARIGDVEAQYDVALMCANGVGVKQDLEQAIAWARAAAERGHAAAQYLLGTSYINGVGVTRELRAATQWLTRAAEQGHERAAYKLARTLAGDAQALASEWQEQAALKGLPEAQTALAEQRLVEAGETGDVADALAWLERAAGRGHPPAQLTLGQLLELGRAGPADPERARTLYRAAARRGLPGAQVALTRMDRQDRSGSGRADAASAARPARERRSAPRRWVQYAQRGTPQDAYDLACMFEHGWGVHPDPDQAQAWYQQAADAGHAAAQLALVRLAQQRGDSLQLERARRWLEQSAAAGDRDAQHVLARSLAEQARRDADWLQVLDWCARAAAAGQAQANADLAELLQQRAGALVGAAQLRAASLGHASSEWQMGRRHARGDGAPRDAAEAARWYLSAAEHGSVDAEFDLAIALLSGEGLRQDVPRALLLLERSARQGHAAAQWRLGELLASGVPGREPDARRAAALCRKAAQAGFAPAQATLALLHAKAGQHARAVAWWEKAHVGGDLESTVNLANACHAGRGVARSPERAFALWLQAAEADLAVAANRVGLCYATGDGVAQDAIEAARWFVQAASLGDSSAAANVQRSRALLSATQWAEAQRRAEAWQVAHANRRGKAALF